MEDFLCEIEEHFLFGTLTVIAVRRRDDRPVSGLEARIERLPLLELWEGHR